MYRWCVSKLKYLPQILHKPVRNFNGSARKCHFILVNVTKGAFMRLFAYFVPGNKNRILLVQNSEKLNVVSLIMLTGEIGEVLFGYTNFKSNTVHK
jgi:hypothetical protein